jgi:GNAT superfamily N-acetyltransferase
LEAAVAATGEIRRIEEAAFSALPALQNLFEAGWLLRFGGGHTKRANSANPLEPLPDDPAGLISRVESLYGQRGLPAIFRLTPLADVAALDRLLEARGYGVLDPSRVLVLPDLGALPQPGLAPGLRLSLDRAPAAAWFAARDRVQPIAPAERPARQRILAAIAAPAAYAAIYDGTTALAVGLGVVSGGYLVVNYVATDPQWRGRGLMRALMGELGAWARSRGADAGHLFVVAGNAPAERLYHALGYRELYRYHYRVG